jgi:hypothetical protein
MGRQNFSVSVKAEIKLRATRGGQAYCEAPGCGVLIKPGSGEVHHLEMDAMKTADKKQKPLTAKDGALWCDACHDPETKKQVAVLAKVKRQQAAHLGVKAPIKNPIKSRGFEKTERGPKIKKADVPRQGGIARQFGQMRRGK